MPSNICDLLTFGADFAKIIYMTDFKIPKGYIKLKEKYELSNDQNLKFEFNALSPQGTVISVFLAKEKLDTYDRMIRDYGSVTQNLEMKKKFSLKIGEKQAYIYIIGKFHMCGTLRAQRTHPVRAGHCGAPVGAHCICARAGLRRR